MCLQLPLQKIALGVERVAVQVYEPVDGAAEALRVIAAAGPPVASSVSVLHLFQFFPGLTLGIRGEKEPSGGRVYIIVAEHIFYLIHDTEDSRKKGKELYAPECRITGNNFDIGAYEQLGLAEKNEICKEIALAIIENNFITLEDVFLYVLNFEDSNYFDVFKTYNSLFERLTNARYQNWVRSCGESPSQAKHHENTTEPHENCCPDCGAALNAVGGCIVCPECGWNRCGE